jgi:hypothetical protein
MLIIMPKVIIIYETLSTFTICFFFAHHIIKVKVDLFGFEINEWTKLRKILDKFIVLTAFINQCFYDLSIIVIVLF